MDKFAPLWEPISIGTVELVNRVVLAAHSTGYRPDEYAAYLAARARGGAALVITGAFPIHSTTDVGLTWDGVEYWSVEELHRVVAAVHAEDRPIFIQLGHAGTHHPGSQAVADWGVVPAPSSFPSPFNGVMPKVMERSEIAIVVSGFAAAAAHAQAAGADGVEVHAAHGYLLSQFLSPASNARTDEYGGSARGRARIILELGRALRSRCGAGLAIGLKLNFDDFLGDAGTTPRDASEALSLVHAAGLFDYFSVSGGNYHSFHYLVAPESSGLSGHMAGLAEVARDVVRAEVPVMVTGRVRTLERAAEIVRAHQADLVGMIRAQIADPELVRKARAGRSWEIRHCVGANQGCWRRVAVGGQISCTVNPATGREAVWGSTGHTQKARRILVVGGGPAGMKLAQTAAERGHAVTLVEQESELGGQIRHAGVLRHRGAWQQLVRDLAGSLERLQVEIVLDTELNAIAAREFGADVIFAATGSTWDLSGCTPTRAGAVGIPRTDDAHVIDPITALTKTNDCGNGVLIVDDNGDYLALGLAEYMAASGRDVTVLTSHQAVGRKLGLDATVDFAWIYPRLRQAGVRVVTSRYVDSVRANEVHTVDVWSDSTETIQADTVVLCMMRMSADSLYFELLRDELEVRRLGDCVAPREVDHAIFEGLREGISL